MTFLKLKNVSKSYPGNEKKSGSTEEKNVVLWNVNLDVFEGEFLAIVGYSGSGKSTLLSMIAGLTQPDMGTIELEGSQIVGPGPDRGIVFQNYSLLPWMTVFENVYLAVDCAIKSSSVQEKKNRTTEWLELVNLGNAAHKRPHELSGGMRQRVAVARGLAMDPKILLLDEPFSALDALTRATLQSELAKIWMQKRKTIVMITNDVEEAILLADRIYPLTHGPRATLGPQIPIRIPRPRAVKNLSLNSDYQEVKRQIIHFLLESRKEQRSEGHAEMKTNKLAKVVQI